MYEAKVNDAFDFTLEEQAEGILLNGELKKTDWVKVNEHVFQVLYQGQSIQVFVEQVNVAAKTIQLKINGKKTITQLTSNLDRLLKEMGFDNLTGQQTSEIKAPMPGWIHSILTEEGEEVQKGDGLLILEAMKMENVIKSPANGIVKKINVGQGESVEKNTLLMSFE